MVHKSKHVWMVLAVALLVAGCATASGKGNKLDATQYAWSAAIRWNDFEGAWTLVDPVYRDAHPMQQADFDRYKTVQVAGYRDMATQTLADGTVVREIQLDVIDRNSMSQTSSRYTEQWRYDPEAKSWWITGGLPDLWKGR